MSDQSVDNHDSFSAEAQEMPFQVVIRQETPRPAPAEIIPEENSLSLDEIEAAYLQALEAADIAESRTLLELENSGSSVLQEQLEASAEIPEQKELSPPSHGESTLSGSHSMQVEDSAPRDTAGTADESPENLSPPITSAEQVAEALLFVGGAPLPVKKFLDVLGGTHTAEQVETMLEALNVRYLAQRRPYEVRLVEGGYKLQLVSEYEGVRSRAYGHGPKEVKLSQDALEVLALIAYQQPIDRETLNETEKQTLPALLRQLLRRELISVDRTDMEAGERYRTTSRFLELFGLTSLEDLPQAGTFHFK